MEGIMAKRITSIYQPGTRSQDWLKIKIRQSAECVIIGYTKRKVERFGALHLAQNQSGNLNYVGKVGTGFSVQGMQAIFDQLQDIPEIKNPPADQKITDRDSVWIEPRLYCEVQYASITSRGTLREAVFLRLREDLNLD
jgi:ATP-dependent DNA ligase